MFILTIAVLIALLSAYALVPLLLLAGFRPGLAGTGIILVSWIEGISFWVVSAVGISTAWGWPRFLFGILLTMVGVIVSVGLGWRQRGVLASLLLMPLLAVLSPPMSMFPSGQGRWTWTALLLWAVWILSVPLNMLGSRLRHDRTPEPQNLT